MHAVWFTLLGLLATPLWAQGLDDRSRRDDAGLQEAVDVMMVRLRATLVDQALDACIAGETATAIIERARAVGWPEFENTLIDGETWRNAAMPRNDSGKVSLGVREAPLGKANTVVTCIIGAAEPLAAAFRDRLQARFGVAEGRTEFSVAGGKLTVGKPAGGEVAGRGVVQLQVTDGNAVITLGVARDAQSPPNQGAPALSVAPNAPQGSIVIEALVTPDGKLKETRIKRSSGNPKIDEQVQRDFVSKWQALPAANGTKADVRRDITLMYNLDEPKNDAQ